MSIHSVDDEFKVLLLISEKAPNATLYFTLFVFMKFLPYFIITHDFNINSKLGISYLARRLSFTDFIMAISQREIIFFIELIFLLIGVFSIILFVYLSIQQKRYSRLSPIQKRLLSVLAFEIFLVNLIDQYIYALITESLFCNERTNSTMPQHQSALLYNNCYDELYYFGIVIGALLMIYCIVISALTTALTSFPYFISRGLFTSSLGAIDPNYIIWSLFQVIIQLEYHLTFNTILIVKHVARAVILLGYSFLFYSNRRFYNSYNFEYGFLWFKTACNISIVIEWIFYFDIENSLMILVNNTSIIVMKLLIEFLMSWILVTLYIRKDNRNIINFIQNVATKPIRFLIETANKVFYSIHFGNNEVLFLNIMEAIQENYKNNAHSPKCSKKCFFCEEYSIESFQSQYLALNEKFKSRKIDKSKSLFIKSSFPFVYKMLEYILRLHYDRKQSRKGDEYLNSLFLLVLFYFVFDENHYKSLFYIEQLTKTHSYKRNFCFKLQINQFRRHISSEYKRQSNKIEGAYYRDITNKSDSKINYILLMQRKYKCIEQIKKGEGYFKITLESYSSLLTSFLSDKIPYDSFLQSIKTFKHCYDLTNDTLPSLMKGRECIVPYSSNKIDLFYSFFSTNQSSSVKNYDCFFNQNNSESKVAKAYHIIVISAHYSNSKMLLKLDYVSDRLISLLKYSPEEFKQLQFEDLLSKTFAGPYSYLIEEAIREGDETINISNFCLLDKELYVMMFNFAGVSVFSQNTMKIFAKVEESEEQAIINLNKKTKGKKGKKSKEKKQPNNLCKYCFLFTNRNGKIVSICRDFESIFFLSAKIIKKYSINIKELLKVEQLNKEGTIVKSLSLIYDNIMDKNLSKGGTIGEDEYSKLIDGVTEINQMLKVQHSQVKVIANYQEKRLVKGKGVFKRFYLFIISLESTSMNNMVMTPFFKETNMNPYLRTSLLNPPIVTYTSNAMPNRANMLKEMLFLIRCFSYKYLYLRYGIKKLIDRKDLQKNNSDYFETLLNEKAFHHSNRKSLKPTDDKAYHLERKSNCNPANIGATPIGITLSDLKFKYLPPFPKYKTWHKTLSVIIAVAIIIVLLVLSLIKIGTFTYQQELFLLNGTFLMIRNTFNQIIAAVLYMLFQSNNLQNEAINNRYFNNSYQSHKSRLMLLLSQFITSHEYYLVFFANNLEELDPTLITILTKPFNITVMDIRNAKRTETTEFLNEHFMTIFLRLIDESQPIVLYFNQTNNYVNKSINYYAEATYVRLIENQITVIKAIYTELLNAFPGKIVNTWLEEQVGYAEKITILSGVLLLYGLSSFLFNFYQMKYLYAKYFICFVELRYFHLYLLSKTKHVLEFIINNGDNRDIKAICQDITIASHQQETLKLKKTLSETVDNLELIRVKAFCPKATENRSDTFSSFARNSNIVQTSITGLTPSQRSFNSGTMNALLSNNTKMKPKGANLHHLKFKDKDTLSPINVSTTSYKGGNSTVSSNVNMISVMTNNTPQPMISQTGGDHNGKLLLKKSIKNLLIFFVSIFLLSVFFAISFVNLSLSYSNKEFMKQILEAETTVFNHINLSNELLLTYQISVLKNEEVTFYYEPNGYLNNCIETKDINNKTTHEQFEELSTCYYLFSNEIENIMTGVLEYSSQFKTIRQFIQSIDSEDFCVNYAMAYEANMKSTPYPLVETIEELISNCQNIGGGLNSKGLSTALNTMYMTLINLYKDFKNDPNRTEASNRERLNSRDIQSFQVEMIYLLFNLPVNYLTYFQIDFFVFDSINKQNEFLILISQALIIILLLIFSIITLVKLTTEEKDVEFLEKCIINTILY